MKHWNKQDLQGLGNPLEMHNGINAFEPGESHAPPAGAAPEKLSRKQLEELYKECNDNPESFLRTNNLEHLAELLAQAEGEDAPNMSSEDSEPKRGQLGSFLSQFLDGTQTRPDYSKTGTFDSAHRTKVDDMSATQQVKRQLVPIGRQTKEAAVKQKPKKATLRSLDTKTSSRLRLSEVQEFGLEETNHEFMAKLGRYQHISQRVYKALSKILPNVDDKHDFSLIEGELNMEQLIEILSNPHRSGHEEYLDTWLPNKRSLSVTIGLDCSGSTACNANEQGETILDIEKIFAIIFARAMQHLTTNIEVLAFDSFTSTSIYRASEIDYISSLEPGRGNRDGDFIRYVNHLKSRDPAQVKYFFLLSDGQPCAENYEGREALEDTLLAMRETVNSGVKLVYLNVDSERGEYYEMFKEEATYSEHFQKPEDLLPKIPDMVKSIAKSVV